MKSDKKILTLAFIISIIGLLTEAVAMSDIRRESIIFSAMEWMNFISPNLSLVFMDNRAAGNFNHINALILNYFNLTFYLFLFIGSVFYFLSKGKETRLLRFSFAVILLNKILLFLFIVPSNLMHYDQVKQISYIVLRTIYFLFNHALWIYLSYYVISQLTKQRKLEICGDNVKTISALGFIDAPRAQRFTHLIIDSVFCLLTTSFLVYNLFGSFLTNIESIAGQRVTLYTLFFICSLMYYIFFEVVFGATPAKFLTESRVVTMDGNKISLKQGVLRTLYRHVPFANLSFLFGPDGAHDYWTTTVVVKEKRIGVKAKTYLWFFPVTLLIVVGSFLGYEAYSEKEADDSNKKEHEFKIQNLKNELSHLDSTVVLQLSNVKNKYEDSTIFLKVESIHGDSVELRPFKYHEYSNAYEIEAVYLSVPATKSTIHVNKSIFKNCYTSDYDNYNKEEHNGESFFANENRYEIENIYRLFGPSLKYDNTGSKVYSDASNVLMLNLLNEGSTGEISSIENVQGNIKWNNAFPIHIDGLDKSTSQARIYLSGDNYHSGETYIFLIHTQDLEGGKKTYQIKIEDREVFISRVFK